MGEGQSKAELLSVLPSALRKEAVAGCYTPSDDESSLSDCSECTSWTSRGRQADVDAKGRPMNTLIVFDWDDTLLCTSSINQDAWTNAQLKELERVAEDVLRASMMLGETIIITNGIETWVQSSARRYLPALLPVLNSMRVLSARAQYEDKYPGDPFAWKRHAFRDLLQERRAKKEVDDSDKGQLNLVVLGDSPAEIAAAKHAVKHCGDHRPLLKTIKFKVCPTVTELLGQLRRVSQELEQIVRESNNAHLGMAQRELPKHLDHLANWASGWRCLEDQERQSTLAPLLKALFV